jgi:hypothetical protein
MLTVTEQIVPRLMDATPRAVTRTMLRRSSSYQALRTQTPRLLTKLRSFSNGRVLSSKATCRRYDQLSREPSVSSFSSTPPYIEPPNLSRKNVECSFGSNSSDATYDPEPFMPLGYDGFDGHKDRQPSNYLSSVQESDGAILDPYLLVPHISITTEVTTLDDGHTTVWAAIEVSSQLCRPYSADCSTGTVDTNNNNHYFLPVHHCEAGLARYGYLYDVRVDIVPTAGTVMVDLLNNDAPRFV